MNQRIFVTGATGYIGLPLARRLAAAGHEVRALVRSSSDRERIAELAAAGVTPCVGDLLDRASMREGMSGADLVVHAAAELDPARPEAAMRRINVEGSDHVAALAYKLGVGRLLLLSSIAAFGGSPADGTPAREETPRRPDPPTSYAATKRAGEEAVRAWARRGLRLNVVWPSLVYGPPGKKRGANVLLRRFAKGRIPVLAGGDRRTSWVFLEDLVDGLVRVVERAPAGRDYLLTGEVARLDEVIARVCTLAGTRPPRLRLPVGAVKAALIVATPYYRLRGWRPPATPGEVDSLGRHWAFDDGRARRELEWNPRGLAAGLPPTVEHLLAG